MRSDTFVSLVLLLSSGCTIIRGSGKDTTQTRELGAFRRLQVESGFEVTMTTGPRSVVVTTDDNVLEYVETLIENDTLVVRIRRGVTISTVSGLRATLSNDVLEGVEASGGARVTATATAAETWNASASGGSKMNLTGLSASKVNLEASGGSDVTLAGMTTELTVNASGGSVVNTGALSARRASIDFPGGSEGRLTVTETLTGSASGGSTVTVLGNPMTMVQTSGDSTVK
jgi:hypothetical protein